MVAGYRQLLAKYLCLGVLIACTFADLANDGEPALINKRISLGRVATTIPAGDQHHPEAGVPATVVQLPDRHARGRRLSDVQLLQQRLAFITAQMCRINDQQPAAVYLPSPQAGITRSPLVVVASLEWASLA